MSQTARQQQIRRRWGLESLNHDLFRKMQENCDEFTFVAFMDHLDNKLYIPVDNILCENIQDALKEECPDG